MLFHIYYSSIIALPKPPSNCTLKPAFSHVDICFQLPKEEVESATEYKIMYWPTDKTDNVTTLYVNKSEFKCPYKISHLEDDTSYTFKVAVANKIAFGADSAVFSAKTNRASKYLDSGQLISLQVYLAFIIE